MSKKIAVLPGDGIGIEIIAEAVKVLNHLNENGLDVELSEAPVGGAGYDAAGKPLPDETLELVKSADAILLGAVGGPQYEGLPRELRRQFNRPALSGRKRQVVGMVAAGYTNAEIADALYLAESTVKGHLASAFNKLGVHTREEAAALVHDHEADRLGIPLVVIQGPDEREEGVVSVKILASGDQSKVPEKRLVDYIQGLLA